MDIEHEYSDIIEDYKDFLNEFKRTIEKFLLKHKIPTAFDVYGRPKSIDSIVEKTTSKRFVINNQ